MIIGLGSDLCNIARIQASLDRFGTRFETMSGGVTGSLACLVKTSTAVLPVNGGRPTSRS